MCSIKPAVFLIWSKNFRVFIFNVIKMQKNQAQADIKELDAFLYTCTGFLIKGFQQQKESPPIKFIYYNGGVPIRDKQRKKELLTRLPLYVMMYDSTYTRVLRELKEASKIKRVYIEITDREGPLESMIVSLLGTSPHGVVRVTLSSRPHVSIFVHSSPISDDFSLGKREGEITDGIEKFLDPKKRKKMIRGNK